jgi:diacylglycerol kinase
MNHILKSHHPVRHVKSFKYAFEGIFHALMHEPNFRIQVVIAAIAVWLGFHYSISNAEWGILIISLGMLLSAEMVNTVVEDLLDVILPENDVAVKIIKDLSAGFVLVTAFSVLLIVLLIFYGRIVGL